MRPGSAGRRSPTSCSTTTTRRRRYRSTWWCRGKSRSSLGALDRGGPMGLLRKRGGPAGTRYRMREKLFAIGDDFWIETEDGERAYKVDGKALRLRKTLIVKSPSGE